MTKAFFVLIWAATTAGAAPLESQVRDAGDLMRPIEFAQAVKPQTNPIAALMHKIGDHGEFEPGESISLPGLGAIKRPDTFNLKVLDGKSDEEHIEDNASLVGEVSEDDGKFHPQGFGFSHEEWKKNDQGFRVEFWGFALALDGSLKGAKHGIIIADAKGHPLSRSPLPVAQAEAKKRLQKTLDFWYSYQPSNAPKP